MYIKIGRYYFLGVADVLEAVWLTVDHKPDMPQETRRIERNGGSVVWLHGTKPYIRGGDFAQRHALKEHPKQVVHSTPSHYLHITIYIYHQMHGTHHIHIRTYTQIQQHIMYLRLSII